MGSITIRSSGGTLKATLPRVLQARKHDSLSGEMTFACRVPVAVAVGVALGDVMSYGGEDYNVVRVAKRSASPFPQLEISGEHVSYQLNEMTFKAGTVYATPAAGLAEILTGTGFSVGTVQVTGTKLLSFTDDTNVRAAVMRWAAACGAEISFTGYSVNLMSHIGSTTPVELSDKKNVESVSVTLDARSDSQTYDFTLYKETALALGDAVSIAYSSLGLNASARVISLDKDPFNFQHVRIVTGTPVPSYVDSVIRALDGKLGEGKPYFGVIIDREHGIRIERSDGMSQALFNADRFEMDALINGVMEPRIWFDPEIGDYRFAGRLSADAMFTDSLYAELGIIAELTVDELSTSRRIRKYFLGDTSDDNFVHVKDQYTRYITGTIVSSTGLLTEDNLPLLTESGLQLTEELGTAATEQAVNRYGQGLYWQSEPVSNTDEGYPLDENGKQIYTTTTVTAWPVAVYKYTYLIKKEDAFNLVGQNYIPQSIYGAGDENGNSKGYIYKDENSFKLRYVSSHGKNVDIVFSDDGFVDAMHRRLSSCIVDTDNQTIEYTVEGDNGLYLLTYTINGNIITYRWPDGHSCSVEIPDDWSEGGGSGGGSSSIIPSDTAPLMDGSAYTGVSVTYARGDHRHPSDTTRQIIINSVGLLVGAGSGTVNAIAAPTIDGTYKLTATVTNGVAIYSWETSE